MRGRARKSLRTKDLLPRLRRGDFAVIDHEDLDEVAAVGLLECSPRAVLNVAPFLSGRYPARGARRLAAAGVWLIECLGPQFMADVQDGDALDLRGGEVWRAGCRLARGRRVEAEDLAAREAEARCNLSEALRAFLANTLEHARREQDLVLAPFELPELRPRLAGRAAVVVVRGAGYKEDLRVLAPFIRSERPVLIAVDGGADALRELGLRPDLIVGDMDSVGDAALLGGSQLIVHAYADGRAPGMDRLERLGLKAQSVRATGTSEDLALMLAFEAGAEPVVAVGSHRGWIDFLEKGRPGMASTLLVRLKLGHVLVDARGVSRLYRAARPRVAPLLLAACLPIVNVVLLTPTLRALLRLWLLQLRLTLGL